MINPRKVGNTSVLSNGLRYASGSCIPRPPRGQYGCRSQKQSCRIMPPADCRPGPVPANPCCPKHPPPPGSFRKYRNIVFFFCFPLMLIQAFSSLGHKTPSKTECRDYEYMRRRTKRFPWRCGRESLFHNERVNYLPGECEPPPLECD